MVRRQQVNSGEAVPYRILFLWCTATAAGYSTSALFHSAFAYLDRFDTVAAVIAASLPAMAQWMVLGRFSKRHVSWFFLTAGALLLGPILGDLVARQGLWGELYHHGPIWEKLVLSPPFDPLRVFLFAGLVLGVFQALALSGRLRTRALWICAVTLGYAVAWVGEDLLFDLLGSTPSSGFLGYAISYTLSSTVRGLAVGLVSGVVIGFCLSPISEGVSLDIPKS